MTMMTVGFYSFTIVSATLISNHSYFMRRNYGFGVPLKTDDYSKNDLNVKKSAIESEVNFIDNVVDGKSVLPKPKYNDELLNEMLKHDEAQALDSLQNIVSQDKFDFKHMEGDKSLESNILDEKSVNTKMDNHNSFSNDKLVSSSLADNSPVFTTKPDQEHDDLSFNNFEVYLDTIEMVDEISSDFDNMALTHNQYKYVDNNLVFLKNKSQRDILKDERSLFVRYSVRKDFDDFYTNAVFESFDNLLPIGENYLRGVQLCVSSKPNLLKMPIFQLLPSKEFTVGKTAYALSHGLRDMHHFVPSHCDKFRVEFNYSSKLKTDVADRINIYGYSADSEVYSFGTDISLLAFEVGPEADLLKLYKNNTCIDKTKLLTLLNSLYSVEGKVEISFNIEGITERVGINLRSSNDNVSFSDGFKTVSNDVNIGDISIKDIQITELLSPLFTLSSKLLDDSELRNVSEYLGTSIYYHVLKNISIVPGAKIILLKSKFEIRRKIKSSSLHTMYKDLVHRGVIIPMSPLQIMNYFKPIDWDAWRYFTFLASFCNVRANPEFESLMPTMDSLSIVHMVRYARDATIRSTQYYEGTPLLPFQMDQDITLSYERVLKEIFVRTVLDSDTPEFYQTITKGMWKGSQGSSYTVNPASLNVALCKFGLSDQFEHSYAFIKKILLITNIYRAPKYASRKTRLSEKLPNIYCRYLPVSGIDSLEVIVPNTNDKESKRNI